MNMGGAISYILSSAGKIPSLLSGFSYFRNGGIGKSFNVIGQGTTHFDMRNGQEIVYSGWSVMWWLSTISLILTNILAVIFDGFSFSNITNILIGGGISLVIYAFFISKGKTNETHWKAWIIKLLMILHLVSVVGYVILIFTNVIGALIGFFGSLIFIGVKTAIYTVLNILIDFVLNVANIFLAFYILNGLNLATVSNNFYNPNMNNGYNPNMNNGYNPNMNNGYNPNMNNGYNPNNMDNLSGLGAVNTVKNQSIGQETHNFNQQNNFGQQNMNQNNFNQQNNQNVQMYACPYCGKPVMHGATPCPHCNNFLNWG